jgi:hypothetical protein
MERLSKIVIQGSIEPAIMGLTILDPPKTKSSSPHTVFLNFAKIEIIDLLQIRHLIQ